MHPWTLGAPEWKDVTRKTAMTYVPRVRGVVGSMVSMTAISPRGARWIVAVGERESVLVWRLKEVPV